MFWNQKQIADHTQISSFWTVYFLRLFRFQIISRCSYFFWNFSSNFLVPDFHSAICSSTLSIIHSLCCFFLLLISKVHYAYFILKFYLRIFFTHFSCSTLILHFWELSSLVPVIHILSYIWYPRGYLCLFQFFSPLEHACLSAPSSKLSFAWWSSNTPAWIYFR